MNWQAVLAAAEEIRWQGRPAPRCYTFRHWRSSLFGLVLLAICGGWQILGLKMAAEYDLPWLSWLPVPFLLFAFYLAVGHLLQARLEWDHVCYAITDRQLLVQRGLVRRRVESMPLSEVTYFALHRQGEQLGTLRVHAGTARQLVLHCVEYPHQPAELLEAEIKKSPA